MADVQELLENIAVEIPQGCKESEYVHVDDQFESAPIAIETTRIECPASGMTIFVVNDADEYLNMAFEGSWRTYLEDKETSDSCTVDNIDVASYTGSILIQGKQALGGEVSGDVFVPYAGRVLWLHLLCGNEPEDDRTAYSRFVKTEQFKEIISNITITSDESNI